MSAPNTVCFVQYLYAIETNIEHLSKAVSELGFSVTVITASPTDQEILENIDGRIFYRIPIKGSRNKKSNTLSFILKTIKFLDEHDFSIVHIAHSPTFFILLKLLSRRDSKFIYHLLSYPISNSHLKAIRAMLSTFIQSLFIEKVIVQSEELKRKMIGIRNLKRTDIVDVGFNKNFFYPIDEKRRISCKKNLKIAQDHPLAIYSGIISSSRQLDRLIIAFKMVLEAVPTANLLMVGDGDSLEELKDLAQSLSISESVIFLGRVPHDQVINYLCISDVGISYIPINENYNYNPPLKTFEYLACGLPTIATQTESNRRIITDGLNGILINDTPDDLANSIISLLKDKNKRKFLSSNARNSIMQYDYGNIAKTALVPLYRKMLRTN
jgi:glycosyltransferase involved in cell wall biosynthesis